MFKKYQLKNGMKVILSPMHETEAVTVLVLVKVGSRYEQKKINGVSHFVEHLMFKGTQRRPATLDISKELDGVGAEYNAFTSKDHTGYYIKANYEKTELALDMLSDILFNSKFEQKEMDKERGVIVEEINMYEDNPMMFMEDLFEDTVYGDHPLGWNIAGTKDIIQKVTRDGLYGYYRDHYQPKNMLVTAAGKIDGKIIGLIKKYFGQPKSEPRKGQPFLAARVNQRQPQAKVKFKDTEQVQLALGFPACSYFDAKLYPLYLMSVILGGNMSSRLFMSIREQKSLCYFIRSTLNIYEDTGNLMIQAGLDKTRIKEAVREILKELKKMKNSGVSADELQKAKDFLKGKLILDLEASDSVAAWLAKQALLRGKILTPTQQIKKLEAVSLAAVKKVANSVIDGRRLNLALIGPYKEAAEFRSLLKL